MLPNLHVELVYQRINGGVHVFVNGLCKQFGTGDVDGRFGPVAKLFDLEHNMGVGDIVEMPLDPSHFVEYVFAHSWCYVYVMSANVDMHFQFSYFSLADSNEPTVLSAPSWALKPTHQARLNQLFSLA